jgi:hypothetical protein
MLNFARSFTIAAAAVMAVPAANAVTVLTFEDCGCSATGIFTAEYKGFSFGNLDVKTNDWFWAQAAAPFGASSGTANVSTDASQYNDLPYEDSSAITSATDFEFIGAAFSGFDTNADGSEANVFYKLYNDGALVFTSTFSAQLSDTATFFASGYSGAVDAVVIAGPQGYYAMDDFTVSAVPEPSTYALMFGGLAALGAVARRRKAKQA